MERRYVYLRLSGCAHEWEVVAVDAEGHITGDIDEYCRETAIKRFSSVYKHSSGQIVFTKVMNRQGFKNFLTCDPEGNKLLLRKLDEEDPEQVW